ncbi:unnamed protein product [Didymodactylos carnosus]|nr:unnamed protein product [Didymodactylos carnosus]CAF4314786.1 unnamed protein product [Didymodactylos carnosus]
MENENNDIVRPIPSSLDSMLNLTLRLEQSALNSVRAASSKTDNDYHRRHTVSTPNDLNQYHENYRRSDVPNDPLLINGLTSDENTLNLMEQAHDEVIKKNKKNPQQQSSNVATIDDKNGRSIVTTETQQEKEKRMSKHLNVAITNNNGRLTSASPNSQIEYFVFKQKLKDSIVSRFNGVLYSDCSSIVSNTPYFYSELVPLDENGVHLIICVHGLDGNSGDLRLIKTYLELCLPSSRLDFLMSSSNHNTTFDDIDIMVGNLINEIDTHIERFGIKAQRISFVGHSLGNLVVRAAVANPRFERYRPMLYTYLSLSGPHLGTLFNSSGLVNMGMWLMQKWKKSCSLSQMSFKDHVDPKQTYLYKLSKKPCLEYFKNILLIASPQDRYVPFHSARIEVCKAALKDTVYGSIYVEMISNLLEPIIKNSSINFVRYNAFHNIQSGTNNLIGRAAHIAILDSELFVEKLVLVSAAKYFK